MSQKPETLSRYRSKKARTLSSRSGPKIRGWTGDDRFLDPERQARIQADRGGGGRTDLLVCAGEALADDLALEGAALVEGEVLVVLRHPRLALLVHEQHEPDRHLVLEFPPLLLCSAPLRSREFSTSRVCSRRRSDPKMRLGGISICHSYTSSFAIFRVASTFLTFFFALR